MASPIVWTDVSDLVPKLANAALSVQTAVLAYVNTLPGLPTSLDGETGPTTRLARIFLAAHMGTTLPTFGAVSSESAGGLSRSYAIPPVSTEGLMMTSFGRQYLGFLKRSFAALPVIG